MNVANKNAADGVAQNAVPAIIIKKVKKGGHAAHHGGAWKVAYADFVTAMMAFFLLLWLLNATTEEQRKGISNYFAPESVSRNSSGSGGVLGGNQASRQDQAASSPNTPGVLVPIPQASGGQTQEAEDSSSASESEEENYANTDEPSENVLPMDQADSVGEGGAEGYHDVVREGEEQSFAEVETAMLKALDESPQLHKLADNLLIDRTDEGLRIQMIDQDQVAMFSLGSAKMNDHTKELLKRMAAILSRLPNKISVTGHTDATPYSTPEGYGNWELSSDRANASRRALMQAGIPASQFARVVGKADQEPLLPKDPTNSRNRRISIVVLRAGTGSN